MKRLNKATRSFGMFILSLILVLSLSNTFAFAQSTDNDPSAIMTNQIMQPLEIGYTDNLLVYNGTWPGGSVFSGYKYLTASGNASYYSGASNTITVILSKKGLGNEYFEVARRSLPVDGQAHDLFNQFSINPNYTYQLYYSVPASPFQVSSVYVSIIPWN